MPVKNESDFLLARLALGALCNRKASFLEISRNDFEYIAWMWDYCDDRMKKLILMAIPEISAIILAFKVITENFQIDSRALKAIAESKFLKDFSFERTHKRLKKKIGNPKREIEEISHRIFG